MHTLSMVLLLGGLAIANDPSNNPAEFERIQAHLAQVERELLAADVSHLSERQLGNRMHHIAVLRGYRERGVFPHNHVASGRTPVFIDEHGTHCAVGFLLAQSGHGELARRISKERNLARVPELADEPELVVWLQEAGFTVAEAARIQPAYGGTPPQATDNDYAIGSALAAGVAGGAIAWNLLADRQGSAWWLPGAVGLGAGLGSVALAGGGVLKNSVHASDGEGSSVSETLVAVNATLGLVSAFVGVRTFALGRNDRTAGTPTSGSDDGALLELAPWTAPGGGNGLRVGIRF